MGKEMPSSVKIYKNFREFLLGGNCNTTLVSKKTNNRYTYKIVKCDRNPNMYFLNVMREYDVYVYAGALIVKDSEVVFRQGAKGKMTSDSQSVKAIVWVLDRIVKGKDISQVEVYHLGKCGVCGRPLTDPASIELGIGPTCLKIGKKIRKESEK